MLDSLKNPLSLIGRLLMAWMFLPAGIGKITGFAGTVAYSASAGLPMPEVGTAIALVIEVVGGLALILGFGTRWAALALGLFTLVASFYFHNFWALPADQQMIPSLLFYKNMAIVGGLLTLAAWGAGAWSLDAKRDN
ncbi:MAG: DoxX family protein [Polaromonas sp.]